MKTLLRETLLLKSQPIIQQDYTLSESFNMRNTNQGFSDLLQATGPTDILNQTHVLASEEPSFLNDRD